MVYSKDSFSSSFRVFLHSFISQILIYILNSKTGSSLWWATTGPQ